MRVSIRSEQAPQLPADHVDRPVEERTNPRLSVSGLARWAWRQLTSMRTALVLLLLLAVAAIPGSLIPQRSSDPNGVIQFDKTNPGWMWAVDLLQLHDVFGSVWFSAIYLLLFASLIGCVIPRIRHHLTALLAPPPATPRNLSRLPAHTRRVLPDTPPGAVLDAAEKALRRQRYRTRRVRGDGSTLTGLPAGQAGALIADTDLRTGITPAVLIGQGVSAVTLWGGLGGLALTGAIAWRRRTPAVA